jgi:hypothetical protein
VEKCLVIILVRTTLWQTLSYGNESVCGECRVKDVECINFRLGLLRETKIDQDTLCRGSDFKSKYPVYNLQKNIS